MYELTQEELNEVSGGYDSETEHCEDVPVDEPCYPYTSEYS